MNKISILILIMVLMFPTAGFAKRIHSEARYQQIWCDDRSGQTEVVLEGGTRVDCLLPEHAVEFDFASKWAEAIGQALHYGHMTQRQAAIVLIIESLDDVKHVNKMLGTIKAHDLDIRVWLMKP
jgi:hypothetical protein